MIESMELPFCSGGAMKCVFIFLSVPGLIKLYLVSGNGINAEQHGSAQRSP